MTSSFRVAQLVACRADVGESPLYDPVTDALLWVDIPAGRIWRYALPHGPASSREVGEPVGSIALVEGGGLLLAAKRGVLVLSRWDGVPVLWRAVEPDLPTQLNDGKCDSRGRFVVGTAARERACDGALYRIDHDGAVQPLVTGLGMSNGLDWSPDERFLYHVDSAARTVTRYDWEPDAGVPRNPVRLIELTPEDGLPDGLSVDAEGCLWLAVWGGSQVRRYDPDGRLVDAIALPTPNVSSCAFGGSQLGDLYITTAAHNAMRDGEEDEVAGNVFVAATSTSGQRRPAFPRPALTDAIDSEDHDASRGTSS